MMWRSASTLMIILVSCGIAAAADLEVLPKGDEKAQPASPAAPSISSAPPKDAMPQAPAQQSPARPAQKPDAPALQMPSQKSEQQPLSPQQLQSPPAGQDKAATDDDKQLNELKPSAAPVSPMPSDRDSWWQQVVRNAPTCKTFSDGCRTCDANFTCSSMPIACQPKEFVCADSANPPSK